MTTTPDPEREQFAATFRALGPQAPTILPGWDAADLLEHLSDRERDTPVVMAARLPGPLGRRAMTAREDQQARPWTERVERFRQGPGRSPVGALDRLSGQGELLIHHEDLRRAQEDWEPRALSEDQQAQAWRALTLLSRISVRVAADITLVSPRGGLRLRSRRSAGSLRVHGETLELLLWASGRDEVAQVRVHGDEGALRALAEGRRGM
ncbi:MAG: TIGR03085 family metal-binding protein [Brachybacterium sp.]|uniref:TIGR03085 family metal-binding protein n=1 Tax=Brachybacterium sp. TaxID=1891286 RepID=UPI0026473CC6|nr:TIGR03085 family metal-binding protein [Brachybacterium sp.]MDN5686592.1 TIGR03085 family metal-binding protein [Brachybacterium sp.]